MIVKKLLFFIGMLINFYVFAQYEIPGNGAIPMPPRCGAQYYLINYCVASNIIPMNLPVYLSESEVELYSSRPMGQQCLLANEAWASCSMYFREQSRGDSNKCRNYWENPAFQGGNAVDQAIANRITAECGGTMIGN